MARAKKSSAKKAEKEKKSSAKKVEKKEKKAVKKAAKKASKKIKRSRKIAPDVVIDREVNLNPSHEDHPEFIRMGYEEKGLKVGQGDRLLYQHHGKKKVKK